MEARNLTSEDVRKPVSRLCSTEVQLSSYSSLVVSLTPQLRLGSVGVVRFHAAKHVSATTRNRNSAGARIGFRQLRLTRRAFRGVFGPPLLDELQMHGTRQ